MPWGKFPHTSGISTIWRCAVTFVIIKLHCTRTIWEPNIVNVSQFGTLRGSILYNIKCLTRRGPHSGKTSKYYLMNNREKYHWSQLSMVYFIYIYISTYEKSAYMFWQIWAIVRQHIIPKNTKKKYCTISCLNLN